MSFEQNKSLILETARNTDNMEEIHIVMDSIYRNIGIPTVELNFPFCARARYNRNGEVFSKKNQLSYNPKPSEISIQRANFAEQQLFYAAVPSKSDFATCTSTSLIEVAMEYVKNEAVQREYFTLSRWNFNRPLNIVILPFSKSSHLKNIDFSDAYNIQKSFINQSEHLDDIRKNIHLDALEFISDIFCQKNEKRVCYKISATYYNLIEKYLDFNKIPFDGIAYPSANTEAAGMNIVLRKEIVDDGTLSFYYAVMNIMQRNPNNPKDITFKRGSDDAFPDEEGNFHFNYIY
jgi:hypothetical protein